jgi:hypothetical protein
LQYFSITSKKRRSVPRCLNSEVKTRCIVSYKKRCTDILTKTMHWKFGTLHAPSARICRHQIRCEAPYRGLDPSPTKTTHKKQTDYSTPLDPNRMNSDTRDLKTMGPPLTGSSVISLLQLQKREHPIFCPSLSSMSTWMSPMLTRVRISTSHYHLARHSTSKGGEVRNGEEGNIGSRYRWWIPYSHGLKWIPLFHITSAIIFL